jgi:hypothetical protein
MGWMVFGVVVVLLAVWLGVAWARVQWDEWETIAQRSPRPWVRRALQRKWLRIPLMVAMEALWFV